jgi:thiamine biosynthesis lipoprotein
VTARLRDLVPAQTRLWRHVLAWQGPSMGGRLAIDITLPGTAKRPEVIAARRAAIAAARRLEAWAARLTRFDPRSDLCRLNADRDPDVFVRPTLAAVLEWAAEARAATDGIVDATLLRERLAAESGAFPGSAGPLGPTGPAWAIRHLERGARVSRSECVRFDLDGVAKGWLADRALRLLAAFPGVAVDADGDIAVRLAEGDETDVGVASPWEDGLLLRIHLDGRHGRPSFGIATSGTTVHSWPAAGDPSNCRRHHLIDPRTRRPAITDVVQATVVAASAREAEILAKTAVILGATEGLKALDRGRALAGVLVTDAGDCRVTSGFSHWLAA